ncbi:MAG: DUF2255 family protein [Saprospiraceae bacterium]|nr:DUF2255 family protein [Saprospiraceae bacterium]
MESQEFLINYIKHHNLIGIKAGSSRSKFLEIWMVVFDNMIFARSWGLKENSWYNAFLRDSRGQLKCDHVIIDIIATPVLKMDPIHEKINMAYLEKYNSGQNAYYAQGIIRHAHIKRTMRFDAI